MYIANRTVNKNIYLFFHENEYQENVFFFFFFKKNSKINSFDIITGRK